MLLLLATALAADPIQLSASDLTWSPGPPSVPPGAKMVVLEGDPKAGAMFTMRLELPGKYTVPLHTHAGDERVTVLSGTVRVAVEGLPAKDIGAGGFYVTPAGRRHVISTEGGAVIQMTGEGPWTIEYADPKAAPRKSK